MFINRHHIGIITILLLSMFILQSTPAFARARTTSSKTQTSTISSTSGSADATDVATAKAALADARTLNPVAGTDTNVVTMAQAVVDEASSGVVVTVSKTSNNGVAKSGAITYNSLSKKGNVTFKLTKNRVAVTQNVSVVVPAKVDLDATEVAAAKAALADARTLNPVAGTDTNVVTMAQTVVDEASSGVVVTVSKTSNKGVAKSGAITYNSLSKKGNIEFKLTKNRAAATQSVSVVVPAKVVIDSDATNVAVAKQSLTDAGTLQPAEGTDTNVVAMAQAIVDKAADGVTVAITSSANSQIGADGEISYSDSKVIGNVTLNLTKNSASATQAVAVVVPAKVFKSGLNVRDYGAKGDGTTDDTGAINKAIKYAASIGGGTVYIPAGVYLVDAAAKIDLVSNVYLNLDSNAVLQAKPNNDAYYAVIRMNNIKNSGISGGKIIGERTTHIGTVGEWGFGIEILSSSNIRITNIEISDCWGDGIYIGVSESSQRKYCEDVVVENFSMNNNRRQGISVISVKGLVINDGSISGTNGTEPASGIDFEPNYDTEFMQGITVQNLRTSNNEGYGIQLSLWYCQTSINSLDILIKNHTDIGSIMGEISDYSIYKLPRAQINIM